MRGGIFQWIAIVAIVGGAIVGMAGGDGPSPTLEGSPEVDDGQESVAQALAFARQHRYEEAVALLDPLVEKNPSSASLREFRDDLKAMIYVEEAGLLPVRTRKSFDDLTSAQKSRIVVLSRAVANANGTNSPDLMKRVKAITLDVPDYPRVWLMQARLALILDRALEGRIAARNLAELRAEESQDASVQATLKLLRERGWVRENIDG